MARTSSLIAGSPLLTGRINGDLYIQTKERFGILPIPSVIVEQLGLETKLPLPKNSKSLSHPYIFLANRQGLRFPALPIHTDSERRLFAQSIIDPAVLDLPESKKWTKIAQIFARRANGIDIFYKVCHSPP